MGLVVKPNTFSAGATILAAEHNDNFDTLYAEFNGNIDNSNIKSNAAIVDTKLAQITTASKVSTSALTGQILDASLGGAVKTGTNSTITAITGLTTPLALTQGGTGATGSNAASGVVVLDTNAKISVAQLGVWVDDSTGYSNILAATDGFVLASGLGAQDSPNYIQGTTDSSNPPTTVIIRSGSDAVRAGYVGIMMPVKKGDRWTITYSGSFSGNTVYWIPLGS